jgi:uncharacterized protein GlcG (DUF336 family)
MPISFGGHILGGIGCSSGTVHQDREVAQAGIAALRTKTSPTRPAPKARRRRKKA